MGLKNIEKAQVLRLGDEVEYQPGQIVSKTLAQNLHHRRRGAPRLRRGEHRHAGARAARGLWADAL